MPIERKLAAIMFTDIVGFTKIMGNDETTALSILGNQQSLLNPTVEKHKGNIIKKMGDGLLIEFPSTVEAVECAIQMQDLLKSYNLGWDNEKVQTMVLATADPVIYTVNSESYLQGMLGTGRVDAYTALTTPLFPKIEYVGEDLLSGDDNIINSGEEAEIFIILFNDPEWGLATNLHATLTENNPYVDIINSTIDYGDISPGEAMIIEPFIVQFDTNLSNVDINFDLNITSNESGYIQYTSIIPLSYFVEEVSVLIGDLNQDEIINILDIVYLVNIILGSDPGDSYALEAGDINQDGSNNIQDIVLLLNMILN